MLFLIERWSFTYRRSRYQSRAAGLVFRKGSQDLMVFFVLSLTGNLTDVKTRPSAHLPDRSTLIYDTRVSRSCALTRKCYRVTARSYRNLVTPITNVVVCGWLTTRQPVSLVQIVVSGIR